ncbi:AAA family ATPase [Microbacterium sp. NPDC047426]
MDRRRLRLCVDVLTVLVGVLLGLTANYVTSRTDGVPWPLRVLQDWSLPLLGVAALLLVTGQLALYRLDRPVTPRPAWDASQPPYPGLEAFTEADAGVFFGRDREVRELVARLHPLGAPAHRFVTVIGPSGSGKSSLVRAGLVPALDARRQKWRVAACLTPGTDPLGALATALEDVARDRSGSRLLLIVDQLEELPFLTGEGEAFLTRVEEALAADTRLWVVATLRSDFLTDLLEAGRTELVREPLLIGVLGRAALVDVIEKPGAKAGLTFPPALVARMVDDTGGGDALPLLAYLLQALYLRARERGQVTEGDYLALGGVEGALSEQAARISAGLRAADPGAPVMDVLLKFVSLDHGEPTRRRVPRADLTDRECAIADAFVAGRLLTGDGGVLDVAHEALFRRWRPLREAVEAEAEALRRRTEVERAARDWVRAGRAEAYLFEGERLASARVWADRAPGVFGGMPLVVEFLDASLRRDRAALVRVADAVARRALQDVAHDPESALLAALAAVAECAPTSLVQQALHAGLNASRKCAVLRGHDQGVTAVAWSRDGARVATASDDGTVRVVDVRDGHPDTVREPVVLTRDGVRIQCLAWSPEGRRVASGAQDGRVTVWDVATRAVLAEPAAHDEPVEGLEWQPEDDVLRGTDARGTTHCWDGATYTRRNAFPEAGLPPRQAVLSPDHRFRAVLMDGQDVQVWALDARYEGEARQILPAREKPTCAAWSPDSRRIAVGADSTVRVWEVATRQEAVLGRHTDTVNALAWGHGHHVASVSRDRTAVLWDAAGACGRSSASMASCGSGVTSVTWSEDGSRCAASTEQGSAWVWGLGEESAPVEFSWMGQLVTVALSPDGTRLLSAGRSPQVAVWNAATPGTAPLTVLDHDDRVTGISWAPDGTRVAVTVRNGITWVRDAETGNESAVLRAEESYWTGGGAWSRDGRFLATSSTGNGLCVWDVEEQVVVAEFRGHGDRVRCAAWSPDGRRVASGSGDGTARVWDTGSGTELCVLRGHVDRVQGVGWSPDGRQVTTASWDGTVRLWDPDEGRERVVLGVHDDQVNALAWHPDGTWVATGSRDGTVRTWETATDVDALVALARSRVFRELTAEERRSLLLPAGPTP